MAGGRNIKGITVEIGGDTTGLQKALGGVNKSIKDTQAQLKDVNRLLKLDPGNTELLAQKQRLLTDAVEETGNKLDKLKQAKRQADEQFARGDISQGQYDALQREIMETEQELKKLEEQAKQSNEALQGIADAGKKLEEFGGKVSSVGKGLLPVTAGITAAGGASAKMAMDFEDAMAKVDTIADTTKVPLSELEKAILDLSNQTGISSSEIAGNVYDAISAGQETGDAVNFVTNSTKLARAGFADAGSALDVLTTIMNAYGMEASEVGRVSDVLIQTQNLGKTTVGELSSSMGKIIPTAKANGVALEQVAAGYALMTSNGVATAESTTYMNSMLNELGKSGTKVSATLREETGKSFLELMQEGVSLSDVLQVISESAKEQGLAFGDLWGSAEAGKAGLILLGDGAGTFNDTLGQMKNSLGATDTAFDKLDTNSYMIQKALNQLKNTAIEFGTAIMSVLAPILIALADKIRALTSWFSGLSEGTKKMIVIIAMIVAAIGPVLIVVGKIASGIGAIMGLATQLAPVLAGLSGAMQALGVVIGFITSPIGLVIVAITALVAGFVYLWNTSEEFRNFWIGLWEAIKAAVAVAVEAIGNFFTVTLPGAWNTVKAFFAGIPAWWGELWTGILNKVTEIWTNMISIVSEKVIGIKDAIVNGFNAAIAFITSLPAQAIQWGKDFINGLKDGIASEINGIIDKVKGLAADIRAFLHFSRPDTGPLRDYETWMPDFVRGMAKGLENSRGILDKAVSDMAGSMVVSPQYAVAGGPGMAAAAQRGVGQTSQTETGHGDVGNITIPVYIGQKMLDEIIVSAQARHNFRSGGR